MSQQLGKKSGFFASYSVIRLEIIDLFLEDDGPEIFAEEFDHVQIVGKSRSVSRKAAP
jgi:hypothetical protein